MRKMKSLPVFKGKSYKKKFITAVTRNIEKQLSDNRDLVPYFVTTVFADCEYKSKKQLEHKIEYAFHQYDRVYRHLISLLMNNFSKKRNLHPRTFDFVDLPCTRHTFKTCLSP